MSGDPASASAPPMRVLAVRITGRMVTVNNPANLPERQTAVIAEQVTGPTGPLTIIAAGSLDPADAKAADAFEMSAVVGGLLLPSWLRRLGDRGADTPAGRTAPSPGLGDHRKRRSGSAGPRRRRG